MSTSPLYRRLARLAVRLLPPLGRLDAKLATGVAGRERAPTQLREWAGRQRDPAAPLLWFHAPSVGEGLQAAAVIRRLRERHPEAQICYTHFSPSATAFARGLDVDVVSYIPHDLPDAIDPVLNALRPSALVFVKLDVWPELACRAAERAVPVVLVAGTVSRGSGRLRGPVRRLLRPGYAALSAAGAISPEDGERLIRLGVAPERLEVTGDPRFDSVVERLDGSVAAPGLPSPDSRTLVAGSTWPADEEVVLDAFLAVRARHPAARLVLVPHEPLPRSVKRVEREAAARRLPLPRQLEGGEGGEGGETDPDILVVDRFGLLARLYGVGGVAFVGGGFGRAGLHSVLEPAAWSRPVLFGPRWERSRDAELLVAAGAGHPLPRRRVEAAAELARRWCEWIESEREREEVGRRARDVVERGRGAADRNAALVERLVWGGQRGASAAVAPSNTT